MYVVDAFTDKVFAGNPAGVVPLAAPIPDVVMQNMAMEHKHAETAFLLQTQPGVYNLRWFTPKMEVALCGHATLAAAGVIFRDIEPSSTSLSFHTRSGLLRASRDQANPSLVTLDFPVRPLRATTLPDVLSNAVGKPVEALITGGGPGGDDLFLVYSTPEEVINMIPPTKQLESLPFCGLIATAPGTGMGFDFVSRFFAPNAGIIEDPVTGSAHCSLAPYWAKRLGKNEGMTAKQVSSRGGYLRVSLAGNRVFISGNVAFYLQGTATITEC